MKTKFLLHGGRLRLVDKRNDSYFRELTKGLADGDQVLFIGFARLVGADRQEVYEREKRLMQAQSSAYIDIIDATENDLPSQIKRAKAIHITGGETTDLIQAVRKVPNFISLLRGKVVGGSSAGACLFSTYYFESGSVHEGLGLFPIRLMAHYGNPEFGSAAKTLELLKQYPEDLELVTIEECAWIVREADI